MSELHPEIASHTPREGLHPVRLHGGPWDGKEVYVAEPAAEFVQVNGPRHGFHATWITHLYERRGGVLEFVRTEETDLSAWRIDFHVKSDPPASMSDG